MPEPAGEPQDLPAICDRTYKPPDCELTTLGWLKYLVSPEFPYYEVVYLKYLHKVLTTDWPFMQGGCGPETLKKWLDLCRVLELDKKAMMGPHAPGTLWAHWARLRQQAHVGPHEQMGPR